MIKRQLDQWWYQVLIATLIRLRVQELVDAMVAKRVEAVEAVCAMSGAERGMVEHVAGLIEGNALRIAGRLNDPMEPATS